MTTITREQYLINLKKAISEMPKQTEKIVISRMDEVMDLVREKQIFEKGIDAKGNILGLYKANTQRTEAWQNPKGYPKIRGERFNLLASGGFFNSMVLRRLAKNKFEIKANVPYFKDILKKVNTTEKDLLGATTETNFNLDKEIIKPELDKWLSQIL